MASSTSSCKKSLQSVVQVRSCCLQGVASGCSFPAHAQRITLDAIATQYPYENGLNRSAPEIVTLYAANIPATAIRAKIRQRYERNKYVDDLQAVDVLLAKSQMDYQETLNAWKMDSHLMRMFNDEEVRYVLHVPLAVLIADY